MRERFLPGCGVYSVGLIAVRLMVISRKLVCSLKREEALVAATAPPNDVKERRIAVTDQVEIAFARGVCSNKFNNNQGNFMKCQM